MTSLSCRFLRGVCCVASKDDATRNTPSEALPLQPVAQHPRNTTQQTADLAGIIRRHPGWLFKAPHRRMLLKMAGRIIAGVTL